MEGLAIVILLGLLFFIFVMPVMALAAAKSADRNANQAHDRIRELEGRIAAQQRQLDGRMEKTSIPPARPPAVHDKVVPPAIPEPVAEPVRSIPPPPLPEWEDGPVPLAVEKLQFATREKPVAPPPEEAPHPVRPTFSIEQFLGVKLFAWLGGVALFFGVIFFVKYAFEHNLIPPAIRITLGFAAGIALLGGGLWTHRREKYRVLAQSLCATGVLVLYGVSFAAHAVYRFPAFNQGFTFTLMAVVTVAAFLTAVRLDALVVAVLGMLGGFITPLLLPLVQDHPLALFGYIALLDIGLLALATRGRWTFLSTGAVAGTILMLVLWTARFFLPGGYAHGGATLVPMGILAGFCGLFLLAAAKARRSGSTSWHVPASCFLMLLSALAFSFHFLLFDGITDRVFLLYGYVLLLNLAAMTLGVIFPPAGRGVMAAGTLTFIHLVIAFVASFLYQRFVPAEPAE